MNESDKELNLSRDGIGSFIDRALSGGITGPGPSTDLETSPFPYSGTGTCKACALAGGLQYRFKFSNGYGASVVRHTFSYGGAIGLWELAVVDTDGRLTYETPITDDVVGRLTETDVAALLARIEAL